MARTITPRGFPAPLGMYSHGMVAAGGELVTVAGQVGIGPWGIRRPEAAGCTMADVVRLQTFLVRADDIPGFMKARQDAFPECVRRPPRPAARTRPSVGKQKR